MRLIKGVASGVIAVLAVAALPGPASAEAVFSGACTMRLEMKFNRRITATPGPTSIALGGDGTCVVNGTVADLDFAGSVATTALTGGFGCAGGVATGTGLVEISVPGFPGPVVQLTLVATPGTVTLVATALVIRFEGVATLAQDPLDVPACPTSGLTATTADGAMVFQDPYPSPI
jgi:hypothetical protein